MISLVHLTKLFLPGMLERGHGRILNLASTLSLMPSPKMAVYGASKAFVLSFTEALAYELKDTGVSATALLPGASDTEFFDRADAEETRVYKQTSLSDPEKVARDGYEALMEGKARVVSGMQNKVQAFLTNFLPDSLLAAGINKLMEETPKD
jgi:short-subunit dehydrogenase